MDAGTIGALGMIGLLAVVLLGVRIVFAAGVVGLLGLIAMRGWTVGIGISGFIPHAETAHYSLSVLPMFILIGHLAFHAGLTQGAFLAARKWLAWMPGGLAVATVFATAGFAAVSGASTATAAVFSRIAIPEMLRANYDPRMAAGVVAAGGTLAALIPPSAILVIYGIIVEESVGKLLLGGFIPGVVTALLYVAVIIIRVLITPSLAGEADESASWSERFSSLTGVIPIIAVVAIIMGGIYTGWMTPTETGAVGAFIIFLYALARRSLSFADLYEALLDTAKMSVMIFSILWGVLIFVRFLGYAGLPDAFAEFLTGLPFSPLTVLLLILGGYVILGMFMDGIGMLLLTLPVVYPAVIALGYDPIWFGIILVKMVEICLITPPIGLNCYVVSGMRPDIPLSDVFRGIWPFFIAELAAVGLFIAFPQIILFLPNAMLGSN